MQPIEVQIWNYIDGTASSQEIIFIEHMIATDHVWQEQYKKLQDLNQLLATHIYLDQPSMRFSKNVMEQIATLQALPSTIHYINKNIIRTIAAVFIFTLIALLGYGYFMINPSRIPNAVSLPVDINNGFVKNMNFNWSLVSPWMDLLLMTNVILLLALLERLFRRGKKYNLLSR